MTAVGFDATEDVWTCSLGVRCAGVWTTVEFAERNIGSPIWHPWWCRTVNHISYDRCRNCNKRRAS